MNGLKVFGRVLLVALGTVVLISVIQFAAEGSDYWLYRFFVPRREAVRREVFEQSRAFNEGMAQELWDMQVQYARADEAGKASLRSIILHRTAGYDLSGLDPKLQAFVLGLRDQELQGGTK